MDLHTTRPTATGPAQAFTGDVCVTPIRSGEEHGHGAAADTFTSHPALLGALPGGQDPTTWLEPVADQDPRQANRDRAGATRPRPPRGRPTTDGRDT